ncbi:MAG: hypothetical protein ACOY0T_31970 [Myxococcota bacterium]
MATRLSHRSLGPLALSIVLLSCAAGRDRAATPPKPVRTLAGPQPISTAATLAPSGIHVARRCYCLLRKGSTAEFGLRLSADESTERGVSIRVFPGASREPILVKAPVVLHPKYEYVKFTIPALPGVEDFQLELNAKVRQQSIGQIVNERCEQACVGH